MRVKIALLVALAFGAAALLLAGRGPAAGAAQIGPGTWKVRADTGVITPGVNQVLRVTVAGVGGDDAITVRVRWVKYAADGCGGTPPVCRHTVASQGVSSPETLGPDDALSFDVQGTGAGVRVMVESNRRNMRVNVQLVDTTTGQTVSLYSASEMDTW